MDCLVGGANFLLKAIHHEAFMYENSQTVFTPSNCEPRCLCDNLSKAAGLLAMPTVCLISTVPLACLQLRFLRKQQLWV